MSNQGLTLTLAGMTTVFSFLILLVLVMYLSSKIILRFFPEEIKSLPPRKTIKPEIVIAIAVAQAKKKGKI